MAPKIERQKKVFLNRGGNENPSDFSRLEATATAEIPTTVNIRKIYMNF